ncbi:MAG: hypothetical protein HN736_17050 [Anaerolineae bacterium]|jgi:hypothetical protein|nr:hypothetical protein [Anaerolineae bacterium]MBT3713602.1 hypothetical protein [Anaerolineae bacterium]MBT4309162.1 hypothetical protein [Anaerolineae bacterium]MBT4459651.1 hypothetical protein [Anaerolineae bacterium]MBT4841592.1 hypothetical protein [Anaerolineae bacterium]
MLNKKIFILLSLVLFSLACTLSIGGPDDPYPQTEIPVSAQAVENMRAQFKGAFETGLTGENIILTITEAQITSFLALKLASENDPFFTDPQVYLRDGQMQIFGKASQSYFTATTNVVVSVGIDEQGEPDMRITSADFGPLPVPDSLASGLSAIIKEAYTGAVGPVATGFRIEQIGIRDGFMVMSGKVK